jgi:hypothetical protein
VQHFADRGDTVEPRGDIGVRSFTTRFGDHVRVIAELSDSAFCYLLALNPNGEIQACWPAHGPPEPTRQIFYPEAGKVFDLNDEERGGLQAFVLLAARQPLPSFTEWRKQVPNLAWQRLPASAGVVWRGDGAQLDPACGPFPERGPVSDLPGVGPLAKLARHLRKAPGIDTVAVCAFAVEPKHSP